MKKEVIQENNEIEVQIIKAEYNQAIYKWISMIALFSIVNSVLEVLNVPLSFPIGFGVNFIVSGILAVGGLSQNIVAGLFDTNSIN